MVSIPSIVARGQQFGLNRQDQMIQMFNGKEIAIQNRPAFWSFTIPIVPRAGDDAKAWRAVLAELSDRSNTFEATPPGYKGSEYALGGGSAITVDGANQLGRELDYTGADINTTVFKVGEYFSVNGELKIVTLTSTSNGSGKGKVVFEPALRYSPPNSDPIEISAPKTKFRLIDPVGGWSLSPNRLHSFTLTAVESY